MEKVPSARLRLMAAAELEGRRRERDLKVKARARLARGRADPVWWIEDTLGVKLTDYQRRICESVRDNRRTAVASCHSVGKDFTAACVVIWFVQCFRPSKVITTAPTARQVEEILWAYIRELIANAPGHVEGRVLQKKLEVGPNHYALGFTASEYNHNAAQGYHADNILILYDESTGVDGPARTGLDSALASGSNARALDIANPTSKYTTFGDLFDRNDVEHRHIAAWDTPNFTTFGITQADYAETPEQDSWRKKITGDLPAPYLCTPEWVGEEWEKCNRNPKDPDWLSRVCGQFPVDDEDALFPLSWVRDAMLRGASTLLPPIKKRPLCIRGVDVARLGKDSTFFADYMPTHGVLPLVEVPRGDNVETAKWLIARVLSHGAVARMRIDADGLGSGVYDYLVHHYAQPSRLGSKGAAERFITEIRSGRAAIDPTRYFNRRAEMLFGLRDALHPANPEPICLPPDPLLREELCTQKWGRKPDGRLFVEPKDEIKKRLGRSPDRADAVCYAIAGGGQEVMDKAQRRRAMMGI